MEHHDRQAGEVRLHFVEQGRGPLVLLLHGFPDYWYGWRHQIPVLVAAGYRVVAVDLRGYNQSERPAGIAAYKLDTLTADIVAFVRSLGPQEPLAVIGHDWGGIIAWQLAMQHPETLRSLVILNAPHPLAYSRELKRPSSQWLRSWYAMFFQLPKIPEALLAANDFALLKRALRSGPAESDEDLACYLEAFSSPGALTAALHYYRAAARYRWAPPRQVQCPTRILWGKRDPFLVPRLAEGLQRWVADLDVVMLDDAGHWLQLTHADQVNQHLLQILHTLPRS